VSSVEACGVGGEDGEWIASLFGTSSVSSLEACGVWGEDREWISSTFGAFAMTFSVCRLGCLGCGAPSYPDPLLTVPLLGLEYVGRVKEARGEEYTSLWRLAAAPLSGMESLATPEVTS